MRRARGLTQAQLAEAIRSSQRALSRYETVADHPPTAVLVEIAKALEVSADELLGLEAPRALRRQQDPDVFGSGSGSSRCSPCPRRTSAR